MRNARASGFPAAARIVVTLLLLGGASTAALAQGTPDSRVAVSVDGAYQVSTTTFSQTVTFEQYSETGSLTATHTVPRHGFGEAGVMVRAWRRIAVGVVGAYFSDPGSADIAALVPDPFVFAQPRQLTGTTGARRTETRIHLQAAYWVQPTERLELIVSGGPSIFKVGQDFVSDVTYTESPPYTTVTYEGATLVREYKTVVGGHVGAEVGWRLARHVGLDGVVRYSHARAEFPDTSAPAVVAGGLQVGGGLRLVF